MNLVLALSVFVLGFATMFFGAISGGVGLVTRPILIFMGFPAQSVVASSRVAGTIGELPGLYLLHKHKHVDWSALFLVIPMVIGSVLASIAVVTILKTNIDKILGVLLFAAGIFLLFKKKDWDRTTDPKVLAYKNKDY